jgi:excinuclease UvrABC nuclease subunit
MYDIEWDNVGTLKGNYVRKFFLFPNFWIESETEITQSLEWKRYKFTKANKSRISRSKGVYCFVLKPKVKEFFDTSYLLYIGKTTRTLRIRYNEYLRDLAGKGKPRPKVKDFLDKYHDRLYFYYTELNINSEIDEIEDNLIDKFIPWANVTIRRAKTNPDFLYLYE